jgi:hypothetical protein
MLLLLGILQLTTAVEILTVTSLKGEKNVFHSGELAMLDLALTDDITLLVSTEVWNTCSEFVP